MNATPDDRMPRFAPWKGFVSVFLAVFLLVFVGSALITFNLPETYIGVTRVRTTTPAQVEIFQSEAVLAAVTEQLDLDRSYAQRYGESQPLTTDRAVHLLRRSLQVRRIGRTDLAEIRAYSIKPEEAAQLANAVARAGISNADVSAGAAPGEPAIIDLAVPAQRPVRPNKPLNLVLGALAGVLLGAMAGGVGARLAIGLGRDGRYQASS